MTKKEVQKTKKKKKKKNANLQTHIERTINRIKYYRTLKGKLPITMM